MDVEQLTQNVVHRFGVSRPEAERMIREQHAKTALKAAVARSQRNETLTVATDDIDFGEDPGAWRQEVQKRMQAVEIM